MVIDNPFTKNTALVLEARAKPRCLVCGRFMLVGRAGMKCEVAEHNEPAPA